MRADQTLQPLAWLRGYNCESLINDVLAAVIVTIMLIPQSLAYALLAGLPAEMGLYSSILPLFAYALFGSSRTLSVGPVAVASLMTASAVGAVASKGLADYASAATLLAFLGGLMLIAMGLLKFGFVSHFLSHPVVSGFITASAIIIALGQLGPLLGVTLQGATLPSLCHHLFVQLGEAHGLTVLVGAGSVAFMLLARFCLSDWLAVIGLRGRPLKLIIRSAPVLVMAVTIPLSAAMSFESAGVPLVGQIPSGLPALSAPQISWPLIQELALPAFLIAIIGFVESVSVGKTLGARRRQRIDPDKELIGLGAANTAAAISGGFPVTGGFSRSVVNFDAGAETPMASVLAALGIALAAIYLTPVLYFLPKAVLAATIVVAVISLIDVETISLARRYRAADFWAVVITITVTLFAGVELGVLAGVSASVSLHLHHTSRPHFAVVGQVPGSEHYRNVARHDVLTEPHILSVRIDESLYFANAAHIEEMVCAQATLQKDLAHVVLMCPAVNAIDLSALEALEEINTRLSENNVALHLSEVKGPVMDALERSDFLNHLSGEVFLSHHNAVMALRAKGTADPALT